MSIGRRRWLVASLLLAALTAAAIALTGLIRNAPAALPARPLEARSALLLLTSLPLVFGENFTLGGGGSPALTRLEQRYNVKPIALTDGPSLASFRLLLMAHPRAQTAAALVDLDDWVRRGGRVLLLADPALDWPSARPFGDPLRPPPGFADTGLLGHWGVTLEAPAERGAAKARLDGRALILSSPGLLASRSCEIAAAGLVARCAIGRGKATIIADADLLSPELSGDGEQQNLDAVVAELDRLER